MELKEEGEDRKKKWLNTIEEDMKIAGVCVEDRAEWRFKTNVTDPE